MIHNISRYLLTLALLLTAVTGAWAQGAFSSDPYTSTREFNSVSVKSSMTLNINEGVIVTVNSGLTIEDGVTLTLTGGGRLSVFGKSGNWGMDASYDEGTRINEATAGEDGKPAITLNGNAKIVIDNGEIYAEGGQGGFGGTDATAGINQPDGAAGNAFSRFPTIDGATLYYKSSNEWFKYTSGDQTLYNEMKAVPATIEVTINDTKTEASFEMPSYDATVSYELVRDMAVSMTTKVGDGEDGAEYRIRVKKDGESFVPAEMTLQEMMGLYKVHDGIENKDLVFYGDGKVCDLSIYAVDDQDQPTGDAIAFQSLVPGRYVAIATAAQGTIYDGQTPASNIFVLYQGYEVTIPAGEYITYYRDEPLKLDDADKESIELYTVSSVTATEAVLSDPFDAAPAYTPLLVYNKNTEEAKTILLIPCNEPDLALTVADAFKGTLDAKEFSKDDMEAANYYVCTGKAFAPVKSAGTIAANRCWLEISTAAPSNARKIVHGDATKITNTDRTDLTDGDLYDLNGRKVLTPTKKGIYIKNGKKVVIK